VTVIRTLIVDDEPLARENLRLRLRDAADFAVIGECASGAAAIRAITALHPDLVFLDVSLPDLDGFGVLAQLGAAPAPIIVFVTAFDAHALEAFRVHALDYLLKPFGDDRFADTLAPVRACVAGGEPTPRGQAWQVGALGAAAPDRLVVKAGGRVLLVPLADIRWIEGCGDYARIHAAARPFLVRRTLQDLADLLDAGRFARVNRSAIVNLDHVVELRPCSRGEFFVRLAGGDEVKLTRTFRRALETRLGQTF